MFNRKSEPAAPANQPASPPVVSEQPNRTLTPARPSGLLSKGVSIKGSVKFLNELLIDGEVQGTVEGNIFATERCELEAGCTLRGDIEAPRLVVDENATFLGSAKVATAK